MEKKFKKLKIYDYSLLFLFDFLLILLALSLFLIQIYGFKGIAGPLIILGLLLITYFLRAKLSKEFKEKILTFIISDNFLNSQYTQGYNDHSFLENSKIVNLLKTQTKTEDLITGSYHGIDFSSFDAHITEIKGTGLCKEIITIFQGRVIHIKHPLNYNSIVREINEDKLYGELFNRIETDNQYFNDKFYIYGDLLPKHILEAIILLEKEFEGQFSISFTQSGIYIFKSNFLNSFEIDDLTSIDLLRSEYEKEIGFILLSINKIIRNTTE